MNKQADNVVSEIVSKKLNDLVEVKREEPKPYKSKAPRRTTTFTPAYVPRPSTSAKDYATRYPAIQTPSVLSKAKVDEKLKAMQELPWPKETAVYKRADFERLVSTLADYMLDVTEGAGLINAGTAGSALRDALASVIPDHFKHRDPFDGEYRVISVEDTDNA
jgi:hypothetical protein